MSFTPVLPIISIVIVYGARTLPSGSIILYVMASQLLLFSLYFPHLSLVFLARQGGLLKLGEGREVCSAPLSIPISKHRLLCSWEARNGTCLGQG